MVDGVWISLFYSSFETEWGALLFPKNILIVRKEVRLQRVLDDLYYERQKLSLGASAGKEEENGKS